METSRGCVVERPQRLLKLKALAGLDSALFLQFLEDLSEVLCPKDSEQSLGSVFNTSPHSYE